MSPITTVSLPTRAGEALLALRDPGEDVDALVLRLARSARSSGFYDAGAAVRAERAGPRRVDEDEVQLELSPEAYDALLALKKDEDEELGVFTLRLVTAARTSGFFDQAGTTQRREVPRRTAPGGMALRDSFVIPKETGRAFEVRAGEVLRIVEVEGAQTVDLNAFALPDLGEHFSAGRTRFFTGCHPKKGDALWSNPPHERPLFTIVEDTVGENDLLFPRCSRIVFEPFGLKDHRGCQDSLQEAIAPYGLSPDRVHDTFNGFMHTGVDEQGYIYIEPPSALEGDWLDLLCHVDCLVALSSCPAGDVHATNGGANKPLGVEIYEPADGAVRRGG
jgi:uncharacterized protein YcgI (DUF1989 family)